MKSLLLLITFFLLSSHAVAENVTDTTEQELIEQELEALDGRLSETDDNEVEKGQLEMENLDQAQQQKELAKGGKQYAVLDKIDAALPEVIGLDAMDKEMDNIAAEAMKTYADLMDLGMNIEARYAGRIFEVAGTNLKTALDAKAAKVDKKLKMVELQLKKSKLDRDSGELDAVESTGTIVDRNELLKNLIKK